MGWLYEGVPDEEHEGHAVGVLANGVIPAYGSGSQWSEMEFRDGWWSPGNGADDPGVEPAWLVPACVCGWRGERQRKAKSERQRATSCSANRPR